MALFIIRLKLSKSGSGNQKKAKIEVGLTFHFQTTLLHAIVMQPVPGISSISYLSNSTSFKSFGGMILPIKV